MSDKSVNPIDKQNIEKISQRNGESLTVKKSAMAVVGLAAIAGAGIIKPAMALKSESSAAMDMKNVSVIKTASENANVLERLVDQGVVAIHSPLRHALSEIAPAAQAQPDSIRWFFIEGFALFRF